MNDERNVPPWPPEAGEPDALPDALAPPPELEDRVTGELVRRGAISPGRHGGGLKPLWTIAASVALLATGYIAGRFSEPQPPAAPASAQYALLLFETEGYSAPQNHGERVQRYNEYSRWVGKARERDRFVGGEELAVDAGWTVAPSGDGPRHSPGITTASGAALSGFFLIRADDDEQALELARDLPHLRHGGQVVVQRTIPTDRPPSPGPATGAAVTGLAVLD